MLFRGVVEVWWVVAVEEEEEEELRREMVKLIEVGEEEEGDQGTPR